MSISSTPSASGDVEESLREALAVPLILTMEPIEGPGGHWICHAEYPELPGVFGEAPEPYGALADLERSRRAYVRDRIADGKTLGVDREALPYLRADDPYHKEIEP